MKSNSYRATDQVATVENLNQGQVFALTRLPKSVPNLTKSIEKSSGIAVHDLLGTKVFSRQLVTNNNFEYSKGLGLSFSSENQPSISAESPNTAKTEDSTVQRSHDDSTIRDVSLVTEVVSHKPPDESLKGHMFGHNETASCFTRQKASHITSYETEQKIASEATNIKTKMMEFDELVVSEEVKADSTTQFYAVGLSNKVNPNISVDDQIPNLYCVEREQVEFDNAMISNELETGSNVIFSPKLTESTLIRDLEQNTSVSVSQHVTIRDYMTTDKDTSAHVESDDVSTMGALPSHRIEDVLSTRAGSQSAGTCDMKVSTKSDQIVSQTISVAEQVKSVDDLKLDQITIEYEEDADHLKMEKDMKSELIVPEDSVASTQVGAKAYLEDCQMKTISTFATARNTKDITRSDSSITMGNKGTYGKIKAGYTEMKKGKIEVKIRANEVETGNHEVTAGCTKVGIRNDKVQHNAFITNSDDIAFNDVTKSQRATSLKALAAYGIKFNQANTTVLVSNAHKTSECEENFNLMDRHVSSLQAEDHIAKMEPCSSVCNSNTRTPDDILEGPGFEEITKKIVVFEHGVLSKDPKYKLVSFDGNQSSSAPASSVCHLSEVKNVVTSKEMTEVMPEKPYLAMSKSVRPSEDSAVKVMNRTEDSGVESNGSVEQSASVTSTEISAELDINHGGERTTELHSGTTEASTELLSEKLEQSTSIETSNLETDFSNQVKMNCFLRER